MKYSQILPEVDHRKDILRYYQKSIIKEEIEDMRLRRGIQWHEVTQDNFFKPNISETNSMSTASSIAISLLVDSLSLSNPKNNLMMRRAGLSNSKTLKQKQKSRE